MANDDTRTVGERGQVTLPKELRDRFDIRGGDEVVVRESDGRIVVEKPITRSDLAEGYRQRAERDGRLDRELASVSSEADEELGDAPEW
ncbi:AbrB/MazE/SpoVT family DNA-binding domain-containing protein [Natronomonas marina]|jgi:AbrB family looped-hinge helix DNA binding protein|uniref:AbrB/MazE/SpoVT family DNA-binding domain-containing protein n=1 Tax=Natronomonas marina TaxID=2961939 RepID=UPI0020C98118|nr:AbrB/MazE/SpoVT family DNA-binding domain-containing protein [Natronomonas marina]